MIQHKYILGFAGAEHSGFEYQLYQHGQLHHRFFEAFDRSWTNAAPEPCARRSARRPGRSQSAKFFHKWSEFWKPPVSENQTWRWKILDLHFQIVEYFLARIVDVPGRLGCWRASWFLLSTFPYGGCLTRFRQLGSLDNFGLEMITHHLQQIGCAGYFGLRFAPDDFRRF